MKKEDSDIRYVYFPKTEPPPEFAEEITDVFRKYEKDIGTKSQDSGLKSDKVLATVREDLLDLGFDVESGKKKEDKIHRPVLFGENGERKLKYEVDGYHSKWECGLEVEAGRAWKGNAVYRDLIQALVMVQVKTLVLAVPNVYKYKSGGRMAKSHDFENAKGVINTLYSTHRFDPPYKLVLIGY